MMRKVISPNKHRMINCCLRKQKADILCLQEVHICNKDKKFITNGRLGVEFCSLAQKKVQGLVIYVNKDLCPKQVFSDSEGRYIAIEFLYNRKKTLMVGLYTPNNNK